MAGQSGISQTGARYPTSITQSGELFPEDGETIPYPLGSQNDPGVNWPPAGYALGSDTALMLNTPLESDLPPELDLEWVQGATKKVSILVPDVSWTTVDPASSDVTAPAWEEHKWYAQVRNPYIFWQNNTHRWQPAYGFQYEWWRQHSGVAEFSVATSLVKGAVAGSPNQWNTKVDLTIPAWMSERLRPGSWYRWDVLSRSVVPVAVPPAVQLDPDVKFHRRGRCRIVTQWTIAGSNYRT